MNTLYGLSHVSYTALSGLDHAIERIEVTASRVAAGLSNPFGHSVLIGQFDATVQRIQAKTEARANARVIQAAGDHNRDLLWLGRR